MKVGLWMLTGGLLLLWTAGMAVLGQLVQWLLGNMPQWAGGLPPLPAWPQLPAWLGWVDPALLQSLQGLLSWLLQTLQDLAPSLQGLGTVLGALLWLAWGLGLVLVLGLAGVAHLWIRRRQSRA